MIGSYVRVCISAFYIEWSVLFVQWPCSISCGSVILISACIIMIILINDDGHDIDDDDDDDGASVLLFCHL